MLVVWLKFLIALSQPVLTAAKKVKQHDPKTFNKLT